MLQEAEASKQQSQQKGAETKLHSQLQLAQEKAQQLQSRLAAVEDGSSKTQLEHSSQLKQLTEQHSGMLSQLRADHEAQLQAAAEHHKVLAPMKCTHQLVEFDQLVGM